MMRSDNGTTENSEEILSLLVKAVRDYAIFALDTNGNVLTWNQGAERLNGFKAEEIVGSHFSRFYTPEDIARKHPEHELELATKKGVYEEEGWRVRKDGSRFWASVVITALKDDSGKLKGFGKVTRDLTERKEAESTRLRNEREAAAYEQALENERILDQFFAESPAFMAQLSVPDFRFQRTNAEHLKIIGKTDILGKTIYEVEPDMARQGAVKVLEEVVRTGKHFVGKEIELKYDASGDHPARTTYLDFVAHPLRRPTGEIYALAVQGYDVTEKVLARKAVENERENFRNLFRQTPEMVVILRGPEHVFEFVNEAHVRTVGFNATGMKVREAQPKSVEVHGILDEVYRTGKAVELREISITLRDRRGIFNLTYSPRRNEAGVIDGIMILGVEVTEQVKAREALRVSREELDRAVNDRTEELNDSRAFLDSVIENLPNMVFVKDARDLRFVRFNKAGEELLGISRDELIGKSDHDLFPREQADHFVAKDREVLAGRRILDIPEEAIESRVSGKRILHTRKIPIRAADGQAEYLLGISEDITEWKAAEKERLRFAREEAAIEERRRENLRATFLAEASTLLASSLDFHETLRKLARLTLPTMADWCTVTILRDDNSKERVAIAHVDPAKNSVIEEINRDYARYEDEESGIGMVIRTKKPLFTPVVEDAALVTAARSPRHLEMMRELGCTSCIVVPIVVRDRALGAIALVLGGERRYNENDLAVAEELGRRAGTAIENASLYESAQRAIRSRDEFLSIASHELKTPLTSLKLQTQMRRRSLQKGDYKKFAIEHLPKLVDDDDRQIDRLVRLVDDMLDISRIQRGKLTLSPDEFDLGEVIRDVAGRFAGQIESAGSHIDFLPNGKILVTWDRFRIEQVLANLLTNAIKYGNGSAITIGMDSDGERASFSVTDRGLGIAPKDQERIFGQFERAISHNMISGLGLGLFISRQIVESHGGKIEVESAAGEGAKFRVEIPLVAKL